ncbi:MAG: response regulator [Lachnospiraceae bacterium]|nr:response regulator [Lachnospiraceae bacterium]
MRIIAVDTDKKSLDAIRSILEKTAPDSTVYYFDDPLAALAKAREEEIDVAFLEVLMSELSGIDLGKYLIDLNPHVNLVYISEHTDKAFEALQIHASGFLKKPGTEGAVSDEMANLRYPEISKKYKRVFAQTFGDFELFVDGNPVDFKYKRTKEMVAVLVNNKGAQTTNGEILAALWEDDSDPDKKLSYLRNLRQDLQNTLSALKLDGIIIKQRGSMSIAKDKIECDLYDWLENGKESKYKYLGDYMNQYSWPEFVHAELDEISYDLYGDEDDF